MKEKKQTKRQTISEFLETAISMSIGLFIIGKKFFNNEKKMNFETKTS